MQRSLMLLALTALCFGAALNQARADDVVYIEKAKVVPGTLATGADHRVSVSHRDGPGQSEIHENETDVFHVLEGTATFVTGGTIVDGKTTGPGQIRGSGIEGGKTQMLKAGDVIIIPKGTPHWFKEVPGTVTYFVVKATS